MAKQKHKIGDRVFYECFDGTIRTNVILDIIDCSYTNDKGKEVKYKDFIVWREGNCSLPVEDYNCLSPDDPRCRNIAKQYEQYDKDKESVISSITEIIDKYPPIVIDDIIAQLNNRYGDTRG